MTRPGMVRADTLDLQDQDAPSAKDHSQHQIPFDSNSSHLGTHQAAEIRHVKEERHSEENNLREAWNDANHSLNGDSPQLQSGETEAFDDDGHPARHEGTLREDGEHVEDDDAEHSSDDDLMDRMSSSPSIDEGAYPASLSKPAQWPMRSSSLTSFRGTFNRSAISTPELAPFVLPASHPPLLLSGTDNQELLSVPAVTASPASTTRSQSSSPFILTPEHFPLHARKSNADVGNTSPLSHKVHHHLDGEYSAQYENDNDDDYDNNDCYDAEGFYESDDNSIESSSDNDDDYDNGPAHTILPRSERHTFARSTQDLGVFGHEDSTNLEDLLLPEKDTLLEQDHNQSPENDSISTYSLDSSTSWATISDASLDMDNKDAANLDNRRDDDPDEISYYADDRFVDSGWGGECLRETEDIDFDFVYALHTFVATVEGQANATKGDTMVLLDDTNSYWWLVRIVKDSSIGYLPAEHIETPTERLARLNKHRNVDLSQTMLGDSMEKSKNPLKKAMRRRNAKTVQFTAPTYVEASDYEYDTEDEDNAVLADVYSNGAAHVDTNGDGAEAEHAEHRESASMDNNDDVKSRMSDSSSSDDARGNITDAKPPIEEPLGSPLLVDKTEAAPLKSRKGTPRNADSFLKDDSAEPRRITLTPNILRDDGSSMSSLEKTRSTSFESLEKAASPPEKAKDGKKTKEKKQGGMLSGLFKSKKKDKKGREEDGDGEKLSGEIARQVSAPSSPTLERNPSLADKKGKLQKSQPVATNGTATVAPLRETPKQLQPVQVPQPLQLQQQSRPQPQQMQQPLSPLREEHPTQFFAELEGSQVAYEAPTGQEDQIRDIQSRQSTRSPEHATPSSSMSALTSAITNKIKHNPDEPRRQKVKKAKTRVELDDFDSMDDEEDHDEQRGTERLSESPVEITHGTFMHGTEAVHIPTNIETEEEGHHQISGQRALDDRVSEEDGGRSSSPSMLDMPSETESTKYANAAPGPKRLSRIDSEPEPTDDDQTPVPSKPQSPSFHNTTGLANLQQSPTPPPLRQAPYPPPRQTPQQAEDAHARATTPQNTQRPHSSLSTTSTAPSPSPSPSPASLASSKDTTLSWSDASLRAWLEGGEGNDVRDMLVVIHDKSDVVPVSNDHPLMKGLWDDERDACGRMMGELDRLLGNWLGKKRDKTSASIGASAGVVGVIENTTAAAAAPLADVGSVGA